MFQIRETGPVDDRSRFFLRLAGPEKVHLIRQNILITPPLELYNPLKLFTMKRYIPLSFIAVVLTLSLAACKGGSSANAADSTRLDTTPVTKIDSTLNPDTASKDHLKMISENPEKADTTVKTTDAKKTSGKKN
jgi:hypothetical protein